VRLAFPWVPRDDLQHRLSFSYRRTDEAKQMLTDGRVNARGIRRVTESMGENAIREGTGSFRENPLQLVIGGLASHRSTTK